MSVNNPIKPVITVRAARNKVFWGPGVMMILEALEATGSMKDACKQTGISYSKAWKILNRAEEQLGVPVIVRQQGGCSGGGSVITEIGRELMERYRQAQKRIDTYSRQVFREIFDAVEIKEEQLLYQVLGIRSGDVISLSGAGGKTTMLFRLAQELKERTVLLTTTTKMLYPEEKEIDYLYSESELNRQTQGPKKGRTFIYGRIDGSGKCTAISSETLLKQYRNYAVTIIEGDGSRGLPVKGYRSYEPCIPEIATVNIGIVTLGSLHRQPASDCVLRISEFCEMVSIEETEYISEVHLARWIAHPQGLFKGSQGQRILFFNQVETDEQVNQVKQIQAQLNQEFKETLNLVVAGSLKSSWYTVIEGEE